MADRRRARPVRARELRVRQESLHGLPRTPARASGRSLGQGGRVSLVTYCGFAARAKTLRWISLGCALVACARPTPPASEPAPGVTPGQGSVLMIATASTAPRVGEASGAPGEAGGGRPAPAQTEPPLCSGGCPLAPLYPTETCADGEHLGLRGPCIRLANGTCAWTHLVCPERATSEVCSCTPPWYSEWSCADGTIGLLGPCVREANGRCGFIHRPCPPVRRPPPSVQPGPQPPRDSHVQRKTCEPLPSDAELRTWPAGSVCQPGGGPAPPPLEIVRSLGDGTYVFQGPAGCFRARYRQVPHQVPATDCAHRHAGRRHSDSSARNRHAGVDARPGRRQIRRPCPPDEQPARARAAPGGDRRAHRWTLGNGIPGTSAIGRATGEGPGGRRPLRFQRGRQYPPARLRGHAHLRRLALRDYRHLLGGSGSRCGARSTSEHGTRVVSRGDRSTGLDGKTEE